jgi:hypothetical protein
MKQSVAGKELNTAAEESTALGGVTNLPLDQEDLVFAEINCRVLDFEMGL